MLARDDNLLLDGHRLCVRNSAEMEEIDVHLNHFLKKTAERESPAAYVLFVLNIYRQALDAREAIEQRFGNGRVGVDGEHHCFDRRLELNRRHGFGDDLCCVWPDDVNAEDLAVLRVGDDFDEAVVRVEDCRLRVADEGELADLHLEALLLRLRLCEAY